MIAVAMMWLPVSRAGAEDPVSPALSATVILLPVAHGTPLPPPTYEMYYESRWVLTDSVTGTEEYRVAANNAMPPGLRWAEPQFNMPMESVTLYFDVETAPEGSGLVPGDRLLVLSLRSVSPSATSWRGNFIVRATDTPVVVQARVRMTGLDVHGRRLGGVDPSVSTFNDANRSERITAEDDDRTVVTINTAAERPTVVAGRSEGRLVPLWASPAHRLTVSDARRRRKTVELACGVGKPVSCAASTMLVYVRPELTPAEGEALCRAQGWKPLHLFRRRGAGAATWYSVLLPEGQDLCRQLDVASRLRGVERATPAAIGL